MAAYDNKSVASCQQTCCKLIFSTGLLQLISISCITSVQMTNCNKPDCNRLVATWWNWQVCWCSSNIPSHEQIWIDSNYCRKYKSELYLCKGEQGSWRWGLLYPHSDLFISRSLDLSLISITVVWPPRCLSKLMYWTFIKLTKYWLNASQWLLMGIFV